MFSKITSQKYQNFEINIISTSLSKNLGINYIFLIKCLISNKNICIDPADAKEVINFLEKQNQKLDFILITHHHHDHIAGVKELQEKYNSLVIINKEDQNFIQNADIFIEAAEDLTDISDNICQITKENRKISSQFQIGSITFQAFKTIGHCPNHVSYFIKSQNILFCGDVLFSSGCGRAFEDAYELYNSLNKIKNLPLSTQIYPAHEYTLNNIEFALTIEPENIDLQNKYQISQNLRQNNLPTIPTNLENELITNPFLRSAIIRKNPRFSEFKDDFALFHHIRKLKDNF